MNYNSVGITSVSWSNAIFFKRIISENCFLFFAKLLVSSMALVAMLARIYHASNAGKFAWPRDVIGTMPLTRQQLDALVLGLPWQRIGEAGIIRVL